MELFNTHISPEAHDLVSSVLDSGRLSEGVMVRRFEQALETELGLVNPVAVNSGTSALHLALVFAGVRPGDRVILPAITFLATGTAILQAGGILVFADVDPETGNICPKSVAELLSNRDCHGRPHPLALPNKAVLAVHWTGLPCRLDGLIFHNITLIQDASHALGATYRGYSIGLPYAGFVCFSFQATKHLTTGDGGAVCCPMDGVTSGKARKMRWFGIDRNLPSGEEGEREFNVGEAGFKYHMNDVAAAIGLGNLHGFKERLIKRQCLGLRYRHELREVPGIKLLRHPEPTTMHAYYTFCMRVERRLDFCRAMKSRGVPCSVIARRIDRLTCFGGKRDDLPGTDVFDAEQISLPCHNALTDDDVRTVIEAVRKGW